LEIIKEERVWNKVIRICGFWAVKALAY